MTDSTPQPKKKGQNNGTQGQRVRGNPCPPPGTTGQDFGPDMTQIRGATRLLDLVIKP